MKIVVNFSFAKISSPSTLTLSTSASKHKFSYGWILWIINELRFFRTASVEWEKYEKIFHLYVVALSFHYRRNGNESLWTFFEQIGELIPSAWTSSSPDMERRRKVKIAFLTPRKLHLNTFLFCIFFHFLISSQYLLPVAVPTRCNDSNTTHYTLQKLFNIKTVSLASTSCRIVIGVVEIAYTRIQGSFSVSEFCWYIFNFQVSCYFTQPFTSRRHLHPPMYIVAIPNNSNKISENSSANEAVVSWGAARTSATRAGRVRIGWRRKEREELKVLVYHNILSRCGVYHFLMLKKRHKNVNDIGMKTFRFKIYGDNSVLNISTPPRSCLGSHLFIFKMNLCRCCICVAGWTEIILRKREKIAGKLRNFSFLARDLLLHHVEAAPVSENFMLFKDVRCNLWQTNEINFQ